MTDEIKVTVVAHGANRKYLMLRFVDPYNGKRHQKSAGTANRKEAERAAGLWEAELREGTYVNPTRLSWDAFRQRYEAEVMPRLAKNTIISRDQAMDLVERILKPRRLTDLTAARLSYFQAELRKPDPAAVARAEAAIIEAQAALDMAKKAAVSRKQKALASRRETLQRLHRPKSEATIKGNLMHLQAVLAWAVEVGMLKSLPKIQKPKRNVKEGHMRGRPISGEEFDRMLAKVASVRPGDAPRWERYLWGLWLSGLWLEESLRLTWDSDGDFTIDLSSRFPRFRIYAEAEKGHKDRLLPLTPDFAEWLLATPESERQGLVFDMGCEPGRQRNIDRVGRVVSAIGEAAGVVVNRDQGKFATAHDLRRSFGTRWASRTKPATLQLLMRHSDISTTLKFYVSMDADDVAAELWAGHTSGHTTLNAVDGMQRGSVASVGLEQR